MCLISSGNCTKMTVRGGDMIKTYEMLLDDYSNYKNPDHKIKRTVKEGNLIKITRGLYETNKQIPGYLLANAIYGPSYLSFDFALSYYGLIPEGVHVFTSATFKKEKIKKYKNYYGIFQYRDIPQDAFPFEIDVMEEQGYSYKIATAEKAVCDKLYSMKPRRNQKEIKKLLFDELRIDEEEFNNLNFKVLLQLCDLYRCTNLKLLRKVVEKLNENSNTKNGGGI